MIQELTIFALATIAGIAPCWYYGKRGGDDQFVNKAWYPILRFIHHWEIGIAIITVAILLYEFLYPFYYQYWWTYQLTIFFIGWGFGTAIDDSLFHSFENAFERKKEHG